jgi:hypothetical protein
MNDKTPLYTIPVPSTSFAIEPHFSVDESAIVFSYERDGARHQGGIKFNAIAAMKTRAERCCRAWHIEGAYDTLVEIENSDWVIEIREDMNERWRDHWATHHYMIYLDSVGCFELIADSWVAF